MLLIYHINFAFEYSLIFECLNIVDSLLFKYPKFKYSIIRNSNIRIVVNICIIEYCPLVTIRISEIQVFEFSLIFISVRIFKNQIF